MRTYSSDLFAREPLHLLVSHVASVGEKNEKRVRGRERICEYLLAGGEYHGGMGWGRSSRAGSLIWGNQGEDFPATTLALVRHRCRATHVNLPERLIPCNRRLLAISSPDSQSEARNLSEVEVDTKLTYVWFSLKPFIQCRLC